VEDDHVDRPGVEERQRLKLTGTNSSIGLIVLIPYAHLTKSDGLFSLTLVPPFGRRYVGAAHQRRRSVDLAKLRFERRQTKNCKGTQRPANSPERHPTAPLPMSLCAPSLKSFSNNVRFADLVVMAERLHPIPFRTRP
jgi:hypothetical protein